MCKYCDILLNVPKGKRAFRIVDESNSYGTKVDEVITELSHENDGKKNAFITHTIILNNDKSYVSRIRIQYCPFCGQRLYYPEEQEG